MTGEQPFVDYYSILRIDWKCSARTLEAAYRHLAKMYHPDHPETADFDKFNAVVEAYRVLRHPEQRAEYDELYVSHTGRASTVAAPGNGIDAGESAALDDAEAHALILETLYRRRRENAQDAGISDFVLREMLNCSEEHFQFHRWYLKAKGFVETTEQGTLAITIEGVDHVIALSRTARAEKLLIGQWRERDD